jgi:hypothetical protein
VKSSVTCCGRNRTPLRSLFSQWCWAPIRSLTPYTDTGFLNQYRQAEQAITCHLAMYDLCYEVTITQTINYSNKQTNKWTKLCISASCCAVFFPRIPFRRKINRQIYVPQKEIKPSIYEIWLTLGGRFFFFKTLAVRVTAATHRDKTNLLKYTFSSIRPATHTVSFYCTLSEIYHIIQY